MTENSKNMIRLLLSVILLACTVTVVAEPLHYEELRLTEEIKFMRKELVLYRSFLQRPDRREKQLSQRILQQQLEAKLPAQPAETAFMEQFYRSARRNGVVVRQIRQAPGRQAGKAAKHLHSVVWDAECSGSWQALLGFIRDMENGDPVIRLDAVEINRNGNAGLSVRAKLGTYYFTKK